ncbi:Phosphatidylinositol 4-phosphate 5-kinase 1 [Hondaea fermentalgiana]|uniref:Phosphatidylinositol 4-phosphate 5-kinase 1 n=1 Tax=Hondaea fermentalgiana TaxID=2315210 RepID=A0A2R5G9Y6_9STRA|nr:Phosphatidylinositol 4-phosphate 5-kinase 1 [Hondaea fermentalgiana]|eukprot:GBG24891.1 Phosphatidylinositol 4-phosphate 5-kinase 1 [Hondaea fermentalgiana]
MAEVKVEYLDGEQETTSFISRPGLARVTYPNGDVYEGPFDERKLKHGLNAKYTFASAEEDGEESQAVTYEGEYRDGSRTGVGKMTYADGTVYRGEFKQGFRHGKGSYTYANDDIYSGEWQNDKRHGQGTYLHKKSACRLDAYWYDGSPVEGDFMHPDGTKYAANFVDADFRGKCRISFPSGMDLRGEFFDSLAGGNKQVCWRPLDFRGPAKISNASMTRLIN